MALVPVSLSLSDMDYLAIKKSYEDRIRADVQGWVLLMMSNSAKDNKAKDKKSNGVVHGSLSTTMVQVAAERANPRDPPADAQKRKLSLLEMVTNLFTRLEPEFKKCFALKKEEVDFVIDTVKGSVLELFEKTQDAHVYGTFMSLAIQHLLEEIDLAILSKENAIDTLDCCLDQVHNESPELDESGALGLKPLRRFLTKPYFKTGDGAMSSTILFKPTVEYKDAFYSTSKQKWTSNDVNALKKAIRDTIAEEELRRIKLRYDMLMAECNNVQSQELDAEKLRKLALPPSDYEAPEPPKRGRGKPKKYSVYAQIHPYLCKTPAGLIVRYTTDNRQISHWFDTESDKVNKLKFPQILTRYGATLDTIDWSIVSNKLMLETKKLRDAPDCRLGYKFGAAPDIAKKRLTLAEKAIVEKLAGAGRKMSWESICKRLEPGRNEWQVFFNWRMTSKSQKKNMKYTWTKEKDEKLVQLALEYRGNWNKVAAEIDERANKRLVIERFKKTKNPLLRFGKVTRVEDCLLMLTIEKLKGHLKREGHFGELTAYLPWRFESSWRDRAENLFAEYIVPWTLEEDHKLLELAVSKKRDWSKIAKEFSSFKTRKGCLTRFKILEKGTKKHGDLESYHVAYSMVRYNVRKFNHLTQVAELLKKVILQPRLQFSGLVRNRPPTEDELQDLLLSYDKLVMASAIHSMENYIAFRDEYWTHYNLQNNIIPPEKKKTHDRRTFNRDNPQSVASALHIRDIKLKKELFNSKTLTDFQRDVYKYYARFCCTKALNREKDRPYLPMASQLIRMQEIKKILDLDDAQKLLYDDSAFASMDAVIPQPRRRGRPKKIQPWGTPVKSKPTVSESEKPPTVSEKSPEPTPKASSKTQKTKASPKTPKASPKTPRASPKTQSPKVSPKTGKASPKTQSPKASPKTQTPKVSPKTGKASPKTQSPKASPKTQTPKVSLKTGKASPKTQSPKASPKTQTPKVSPNPKTGKVSPKTGKASPKTQSPKASPKTQTPKVSPKTIKFRLNLRRISVLSDKKKNNLSNKKSKTKASPVKIKINFSSKSRAMLNSDSSPIPTTTVKRYGTGFIEVSPPKLRKIGIW